MKTGKGKRLFMLGKRLMANCSEKLWMI